MSEQIQQTLNKIVLTDSQQPLSESGAFLNIQGQGDDTVVEVIFSYPNQSQHDKIKAQMHAALATQGLKAEITISNKIQAHKVQEGVQAFNDIKNIIAVASAKGGVGKSTVSVNLACALAQEGAVVGLLDADIYGPSIPTMMGIEEKPQTLDGKTMEPLKAHGIKTMSIGYLVPADSAMIWRGPILTQTLTQLLNETNWGALDYLILDLPPGTGDTQLTLAQKIPVSGAVIVTTPQEVALADARKGLAMFEKVRIAVLGIVENMSGFICPCCGHEEPIFSTGGGEQLAKKFDTELLGTLPINTQIRQSGDQGAPFVTTASTVADRYRSIARRTAYILSQRAREYSSKFPKIVVE